MTKMLPHASLAYPADLSGIWIVTNTFEITACLVQAPAAAAQETSKCYLEELPANLEEKIIYSSAIAID